MKTRLILATENSDDEVMLDLPFLPRVDEWVNVPDFIDDTRVQKVKEQANCWSGARGLVQSVEYKKIGNDLATEIYVWCED